MTSVSLNSALIISSSGLNAAQAGMDVVSRNVSNAQVPGYTSKQLPVESIVAGDANSGVRTLAVTRSVNQGLLRQLQGASSTNQQMTTQNTFLQSFQNNFGQPGNTTNIAAQLGNLQNAVSALTSSPNDPTAQTQAITSAQNVTQQFNLISQNISNVRQQADSAISTSVGNINTALNQIYALNNQIVSLQAQGQSTADLQDQRDTQINAIAQEIGISTSTTSNGAIYVATTNGTSLLDATFVPGSSPVSFTPTPVVLPTAAYYPPPSTTFGTLSGIKVGSIDITPQIQSGNIAGDLAVRDTILPTTQSQLDELGAKLITSFNSQDLQLFQAGTQTLPSNLQVLGGNGGAGTGLASGDTSMTLGSVAGLSAGMSLQLAGDSTAYQITGVNSGTNTITFAQVGSTTGAAQASAYQTNVTFGPAVPQIAVGSAGAAATGVGTNLTTNAITLGGAVGAQVGMRIQFLNQNATYTITGVSANASGQQTISVQADGGGVGLLAPIANSEGIRILPPVIGLSGLAGTITVNPTVINNPWRMRDGTRVQTPSTLTGNNALPTSIVAMFNAQQSFTNNTGLPTSSTLQNFATSAVAYQANQAATTQSNLDSASTIYNALNKQFQDSSGVNVDQQLANMIQIQSSYAASARTMTAIKTMMDQLLQAVQ